ncbi:hypothetical protein ACSSS7_005320 [Eimeria intestinalis]
MASHSSKAGTVSFTTPPENVGRGGAKPAHASSPQPAPAAPAAAAEVSASPSVSASSAASASAGAAAGEEEPKAGHQVVGFQMLCEGVMAVHPARPPVATPAAAAAASEAAEAAEAAAAIAAIGPADFRSVKSLSLSNRNLLSRGQEVVSNGRDERKREAGGSEAGREEGSRREGQSQAKEEETDGDRGGNRGRRRPMKERQIV